MHKCAYNGRVGCEWDPAKALANYKKHGVRFADAETALSDEQALTIRDPSSADEERWDECWWSSMRGAEKRCG